MRKPLLLSAIVLGLAIAGGALVLVVAHQYPWIFSRSYTIRVATGPISDQGAKFIAALKRQMALEHPRVQIVTVETANLQASGEAFKDGKVDAAMVRSDDPIAADGRTIAILRKLAVALMVPAHSSVTDIAGLSGEKIGVISAGAEIDPIATRVLDFLGISASHIVRLGQNQVAPSIKNRHVGVLLAVGPVGPGGIADAVQIIRTVTKKVPSFLDLDDADAITNRYPFYETAEIPEGTFVGRPAVPSDSVSTIAATVRLIASPSMSNYTAGELTRLVLETKAKVATVPGASQIDAPDTDLSAFLPVHPGTVAYLNGNAPNLWDQIPNYAYLITLVLGAVGSLGAWIVVSSTERISRSCARSWHACHRCSRMRDRSLQTGSIGLPGSWRKYQNG
jgi:TRAP-type uncharacterized transport system substrate-binding protein